MKIFSGKTYKGRKHNRDIDEIQFSTVINGNGDNNKGNYTEFAAITRTNSIHAGTDLYMTGKIEQEERVSFYSLEFNDNTEIVTLNFPGLSQSVLNAYKNLSVTPLVIEANGTVSQHSGGDFDVTVSDHEGEPSRRYRPHEKGNDAGTPKDHHIRSGYRKIVSGKEIPIPPCVIHPEQFSSEELINLGFSPDGVPSKEVVRDYSELSREEVEEIIRKRGLRGIEEIREEYSESMSAS